MMNNSPFDDNIKKRFERYEPEVPARVWQNIMAGKEKRRPAGFLFNLAGNRLVFALLVLTLSVGGALLVHHFNNNPGKKVSATLPGTKQDKENNNTSTTNVNTENVNKITTNQNDPVNGAGSLPVSDANTKLHDNNQPVQNGDANAVTPSAVNTPGANAINKNLHSPGNKKIPVINNNNPGKKNDKLVSPGNVAADQSITAQVYSKAKRSSRTSAKTQMRITDPGTASPEIKDAATDEAIVSPVNSQDVSLQKNFLTLSSYPGEKTFSFAVKNSNVPALNIPCPRGEKNTAGNKRYFEIYGGPDYVFRTFNDTANSAYLQKRKESTHFSSAFSVGFRYTKVFNNAISFRTGINYSQVNEKFKYEQGHLIESVYIIDSNGDTTGSYATTGTRYKTTHNKYRTIDIPLVLGYEMGNGRLHTNINAGFVVNLYSWQKGDVLDNSFKPVTITTGKSSSPYQFKTNVGLGFMGGVSFYYKLTNSLHVLGEPYFRYNFSAANKSDITLKQKYTTIGLRLGLRIDF